MRVVDLAAKHGTTEAEMLSHVESHRTARALIRARKGRDDHTCEFCEAGPSLLPLTRAEDRLLAICETLCAGGLTVADLAGDLGKSTSTARRWLRDAEEAGLVSVAGSQRVYDGLPGQTAEVWALDDHETHQELVQRAAAQDDAAMGLS